MPLPSFTITGTLFDLLGNVAAGEIVGNGMGGATPATVTFTSNVPAGYFVTFGGAGFRVDEVTGIVNSDGTITRNGEVVQLLANDAGLSIEGLQWQVHVSGMKRFWFNAPVDGGTVNLGTVVPVPGLGVGGVAFSEGELVTLLANSGSSVRAALDALYITGHDEYHEYANVAAFPATGVADRIYVALSPSGFFYRWTGSAYNQVGGLPVSWSDIASKPAVIGAGADQAAARTAIDAASIRDGARSAMVAEKVRGGNITAKPGYQWSHLWAEWDWDNWIKPQVDRAVLLGMNTVRLIGGVKSIGEPATWYAWAVSTVTTLDTIVVNGGRAYRCTTAGTTASSGSGPSGTGSSISDGSVTWTYVRQDNLAAFSQATLDARWAQLVQYCQTKGLNLYPCLCTIDDFSGPSLQDYQNAGVTGSVVTSATLLSAYPNVVAFDVFQESDPTTGRVWAASTAYLVNDPVNNGGKAYKCTTAGTSAASGGPTGTSVGITDGTAVWSYVGIPLLPADVLALLARIRAVCNVPLTMSAPGLGSAFWAWGSYIWDSLLSNPLGLDFADVHIYDSTWTSATVAKWSAKYGKPVLLGEFGAGEDSDSGEQSARYTQAAGIHAAHGVIGSLVWALADQGFRLDRKYGVWDNTGFTQPNAVQAGTPLSTTAGQKATLVTKLRAFTPAQNVPTPTAFYDTAGATTLGIATEAAAVNYMELRARAVGHYPEINMRGSAANIGVGFLPKGDGSFIIYRQAGFPTAIISALGADTDVSLDITTQGAGIVKHNGVASSLTQTAVKTTTYTAVAGDLIPADATAGSFTITLPSAPTNRSRIAIKRILPADPSANVITIAAGGTDVFNHAAGSTSLTLTVQNQAVSLQYAAATGIWYVVSTDVPLSYALSRTNHTGTQSADTLTDGTTNKAFLATERTKLTAITGTNTGDQTSVTGNAGTATTLATPRNIDGQAFNGSADVTVIAPGTHAATSKATPVDADEIPLVDSAASNVLKKLTWANIKATLGDLTATASSLVKRDGNANIRANAFIPTYGGVATAAGTTAYTVSSPQIVNFTGSTTQIAQLPTTSVVQGQQYTIINSSSGVVTVNSSGGNLVKTLAAGTSTVATCLTNTPTTAAHWFATA